MHLVQAILVVGFTPEQRDSSSTTIAPTALGRSLPSSSKPSITTNGHSSSQDREPRGGKLSSGKEEEAFEEYELVDFAKLQQEDQHRKRTSRDIRREAKRAEKIQRLDEEDEMKFSHSIQFNAVPDWSSHYIAYSNLKKLIYHLEKTAVVQGSNDPESAPLLSNDVSETDVIFRRQLDAELEKISSFYQVKELEIYGELDELLKEIEAYDPEVDEDFDAGFDTLARSNSRHERPRSSGTSQVQTSSSSAQLRRTSTISASIDETDNSDEEEETAALNKPRPKRSKTNPMERSQHTEDLGASTDFSMMSRSHRRNSQAFEDYSQQILYSTAITLKKRSIALYVQLCELKSFIQLNKTGFSKVLKKYDKICNRNLRSKYIESSVNPAYPFRESTMSHLEENISRMEKSYASIVTGGDVTTAKKELRAHLREHVVWERNTVWRDMIGIERKAQAANMGVRRTLLGLDNDPSNTRLQGDDDVKMVVKSLNTPIGTINLPSWLLSSSLYTLLLIIAIFFVLVYVPGIMEKPEQQNCLAILVFVSLLWATEVIPLFVTSLLIPFLVVVLRVVRSDDLPHKRLDSKKATAYIFAAMWTPVIMLLLGGFTIAAALSKYDIAKRIATVVLSRAGTRPRTVLLTNMFVAAFASMWISNVAAPVLCLSIIQPMLRNLPSDSQMSKALILGIALASNIGGMLSPIASPQNIIALQNMEPKPSWAIWFFIVLPIGIISILLIWTLLLITFKPGKGTTIIPIRPVKDKFSGIQWFITFVTIGTIILWCITHQLEHIFGDMGVVAIIPLILFFGTGILTKEDFNNFLWTIIILAAGGLALGKAVSSSGLLHTIANHITSEIKDMGVYGVLVVFAALILVVATFISHTVAALIILPVVREVGEGMKNPHPNLLVLGGALMCSAAMGLPTSGFPNMTAIMTEDPQTGQRYLRVRHFISRGIPSSVLTLLVVISVGYGLMLVVGM